MRHELLQAPLGIDKGGDKVHLSAWQQAGGEIGSDCQSKADISANSSPSLQALIVRHYSRLDTRCSPAT